jgi:membrane protein insertase Oxa1/YidC/SpoIIIJ
LNYSDFKTEAKQEKFKVDGNEIKYSNIGSYTNAYEENSYNLVTAKLDKQKSEANGYYILILLSIGTILLQQWITMRSQKEQSQFSTVDGQGAQQQKTTMIMMTVMFAFFSFMYSAAFSIYMIMSNVLSLFSTLVINKLVDISQNKKEAEAFKAKYDHKYAAQKRKEQNVKGKNKKK